MINAEINELKKTVSFNFLFTEKLNCSAKKHFINNKQTPEFQENIASFSSYNVRYGHLTASLDAFLLLQCWCGTYVIQTLTLGKQLVNFITCGCESSDILFEFTKLSANPRRIGDRLA